MSKTEKLKSWRDVIKAHPAADLFPMMSPDELKALGEDIKKHGMAVPIVWWTEREADIGKTPPPKYQLLDGRNRLDAMEMVGIKLIDANGKTAAFRDMVREDVCYGEGTPKMHLLTGKDSVERTDPYELVLSANVHRRHLTAEQKREIVAAVLKAQPEKSNRTIAKQTKVDHKTVGAVRDKLEAGGEIPHHDVREDARGTKQPTTKKKRRSVDEGGGVVIDSGPIEATDALRYVPQDKWHELMVARRRVRRINLNYDCRCLLQFVNDAEAMHKVCGFASAEAMIREGYDLESTDIALVLEWLRLNPPIEEPIVLVPAIADLLSDFPDMPEVFIRETTAPAA